MADPGGGNGRFVHRIKVRYGEVDMQGVVFNAHYLAYCDDAYESWFQALGLANEDHGYDMMLKKAVVEWHGSATRNDVVEIAVGVRRWGKTSVDIGYEGSVGGRPVFSATVTYVGVEFGTTRPVPPPAEVRARLGEPAP